MTVCLSASVAIPPLAIEPQRQAPLQQLNTLALEASASAFVRVESDAMILDALAWARSRGMPVLPLGEGSNVVLAGNLNALVLQLATQGVEELERSSERVVLKVAAGEPWHAFVKWTLSQGFYGLENLALIPGTVGAAPIQNIGAYGVELQEFVQCVHAIQIEDSAAVTFTNDQCRFGYRDSVFKHAQRDRLIVTAVELALPLVPRVNTQYPALSQALADGVEPSPQAVFDAVVALRRSKLPDPAVQPNAGSFFKNPVLDSAHYEELCKRCDPPVYPQADGEFKIPAAWLIDQCGWKGMRRNDQGVHPDHALVLVNYGNPSGEALLRIAADIQRDVQATYDIALEIEPRVYGHAQ